MGKRRFDSAAARHPAPAIIDNLNWGATLNDKPPADSVTEMAFSSDNLLSVSGWDNAVRIYKVEQNGQSQFRHAFKHGMPVLGCDFSKVYIAQRERACVLNRAKKYQ
jgi:mRNA export factor